MKNLTSEQMGSTAKAASSLLVGFTSSKWNEVRYMPNLNKGG